MALAADPFNQRWLFYVGLTLLVLALALPTRTGETPGDRVAAIWRHFPGRLFRKRQ